MFSDFLNLFFPRICAVCQQPLVKNEEIICLSCQIKFPRTNFLSLYENPLKDRFTGKVDVKYAMALFNFHKAGITQKLLHQLKYGNRPEIGQLAGRWLAAEIIKHNKQEEFDIILPVPLHKQKKRKRGYNQSDHFAMGIASALNILVHTTLIRRIRKGESQTHKTRMERWENVNQAFQVVDPDKLKEKRVLLVDDVITTGATIEACILPLKDHGVSEISVASIAMAK